MTETGTFLRHKWEHRDKWNAVCVRCGTWAQKRPHPHTRRWFTEWRLPDGTYTDNLSGGRTPPCQPALAPTAPRIGCPLSEAATTPEGDNQP